MDSENGDYSIVERLKTSLACEEIVCVMQKVAVSYPDTSKSSNTLRT